MVMMVFFFNFAIALLRDKYKTYSNKDEKFSEI